MFKKPFVVQTTTKVKGSDLKKIKAKILKNYAFDEDDLEEMLPPKCCKMQLDIKAFIYVTEEGGQPVFIETDRGDVFPTVFTMWNFPKVAPTISIHAPVSSFVCTKGADVMLPGCAEENLGDFESGDHRMLLVHHAYVGDKGETITHPGKVNAMPIAVGIMDVSRDEIEDIKKGKAMRVIHYYGDQVWEFGGGGKPNPGFKDGSVDVWEEGQADEDEEELDLDKAEEEADAARVARAEKMEAAGETGDDEFGGKKKKKKKKDETEEERKERKDKEKKEKKKEKKAKEAAREAAQPEPEPAEEELVEPEPAPAPAAAAMSMEEMIEYAFVAAIVQSLDDKELPMPFAEFYAKHMIKFQQGSEKLDFKKSSFKKIAKFAKEMAKKKLCTVKEAKGEAVMLTVDRLHKTFKAFDPALADASEQQQGGGGGAGGAASLINLPVVKEKWKPDSSLLPIFVRVHGEIDKGDKGLFTIEECTTTLHKYLICEGLITDEGVSLDEILKNGLYKGFGNKGEVTETVGNEADMRVRMKKRLLEYHEISGLGGEPVTKKGHVPEVRVEENRGHGHNVTLVSGLETFGWVMEDIAQHFKKKLMCTCSVELLPGRTQKNKEVTIQGHHGEKVVDELVAKYGMPKQYINYKKVK